jgi:PPOX class probable F420-dependent enzyme
MIRRRARATIAAATRQEIPMSTTLADARIQAFLATKEVALLATVNPGGAPLAMPMWFLHDPASLTMISVEGTQKVRNLRRDPRVCVVAESGTRADIRGVTVQGRAELLADGEERRRLAERFHAKYDPNLERLWGGRAMPANRVMFRIVPERVRSWGLGA